MKRIIKNIYAQLDGTIVEELLEEDIPVPSEVTNFQARAALMSAGLFNLVDSAIKDVGGVSLQAWEYANTISRNGVLVNNMATQLGLTEEQLDQLFINAAAIEA